MNLLAGWVVAQGVAYLNRRRDESQERVSETNASQSTRIGPQVALSLSNPPSQTLDAYTYSPLTTTSSIRLLSLTKDDVFGYSCCLHIVDLDSAPPFQALSYTWGDPLQFPELEGLGSSDKDAWMAAYKAEYSFKIDGKSVIIKPGRNLHDALSHLWHADESLMQYRYLWVDAICINQQDNTERKAQVLMMGEIYSKAQKVIAWLGNALPSTHQAVEFIEKLGRLPQSSWERMQKMDISKDDAYNELGISPVSEQDRKSLTGFLMRGWFNRVWIVQEAVFGQSITFVSGRHVIQSDLLFNVSKMLVLTGWSSQLMVLDVPEIGTKQMVPPGGIAAVALMKEQLRSVEKPSPLNIMASMRSRQATEPADSVYGLLNVLAIPMGKTPKDLFVQPDVDRPLEEVMEKATLMLIRHEQDLVVLHQVQEHSLRAISGCSSWTVNWRQRMVPEPLIMATQHGLPWKPAGTRKKQCPDTSIPRKLRFEAARIASVAATTPDYEEIEGDFAAWLRLATELSKEPYGIELGQGIAEILSRTIVADCALDQHPAPDDVGDALVLHCLASHAQRTTRFWAVRAGMEDALFCDAIKRFNASDRASPFPSDDDIPALLWAMRGDGASLDKPHVRRFLDKFEKQKKHVQGLLGRIHSVMFSRRLARLESNLLAAVPASAGLGDEIWIVPGLQTPFVLREVEGEYEFVGEAYVHGIMNGEMADFVVFRDITLR